VQSLIPAVAGNNILKLPIENEADVDGDPQLSITVDLHKISYWSNFSFLSSNAAL